MECYHCIQSNGYLYNFPAKKDPEETPAQLRHVLSEVLESMEAYEVYLKDPTQENLDAFLQECEDSIHCMESEMRKYNIEDIDRAKANVVKKNLRRGYYDVGAD